MRIAKHLHMDLGSLSVDRFSDGEIKVEVEESVRGQDIYVIQPTCAPTNDNLMELLIMADALKRSAAATITAVIPFFGYARQDRRPEFTRVPITAKLIANLIKKAGITQVITVELHAPQEQGFFDIPIIDCSSIPIISADIWKRYGSEMDGISIVSPDVGGVVRARKLAKVLDNHNLVIIDKRRPAANKSEVMNVIGKVNGMNCIIVDDMVDTAGTLAKAAAALIRDGAASVVAYCTHPILSGAAYANIELSVLSELVVTDSIPLHKDSGKKIREISVSELVAETMHRAHYHESVSSIFT